MAAMAPAEWATHQRGAAELGHHRGQAPRPSRRRSWTSGRGGRAQSRRGSVRRRPPRTGRGRAGAGRGPTAAATSHPSRARGMPSACPTRRRPGRGRCRRGPRHLERLTARRSAAARTAAAGVAEAGTTALGQPAAERGLVLEHPNAARSAREDEAGGAGAGHGAGRPGRRAGSGTRRRLAEAEKNDRSCFFEPTCRLLGGMVTVVRRGCGRAGGRRRSWARLAASASRSSRAAKLWPSTMPCRSWAKAWPRRLVAELALAHAAADDRLDGVEQVPLGLDDLGRGPGRPARRRTRWPWR